MLKEFEKRILSSIILIPIVTFLIIKGSILFISFLILLFLATSYEWFKMCKKNDLLKFLGITFLLFSFLTSFLIREQLKLKKGGRTPGRSRIATMTKAQVEAVAKEKMEDLNALDLEGAMKIVAGQARSMGIDVKE